MIQSSCQCGAVVCTLDDSLTEAMVASNLRCAEKVALPRIKTNDFDGASL